MLGVGGVATINQKDPITVTMKSMHRRAMCYDLKEEAGSSGEYE